MSVARTVLLRASRSQWLAERVARRPFVLRAVGRFMPGEEPDAALAASADLARHDVGTVLTCLGERTATTTDALGVRDHYLGMLDAIQAAGLPTHISVKPTHLGLDVDAGACTDAVLALARRAEATGSFLWIDMEESWYVDRTLDLYRSARAVTPRAGICLQSYLRRTSGDLDALGAHAAAVDGGGVAVRLVKGAYREDAQVAFQRREEVDDAFALLAERLLADSERPGALPVLGTHDFGLVARIRRTARNNRVPDGAWELHTLYGIAVTEQRAIAAQGVAVRTLISYGRNWFPWYMRRLAERPANVMFVVRSMLR
jgi:proline dehydrogenase